ncbi:MAG: phosphonoacetaldehyde reductase [Oscillospiraceae bacterium]|nr:phosphonoacetaldehyde reductase [Oscillospiraceae bacterium]
MNSYYNPVKVIYGNGAINEVKSLIDNIISPCGRVLIITWNEFTEQLDVFAGLYDSYEIRTVCFKESNPTVEQLFDLYYETSEYMPEVVIAIGGGSVMDVAKSLCCFYGKEISSPDEMRRIISEKNFGIPRAKWIGVPTTSGTGSEVTCWATIWDPTQNVKRSVESHNNFAYAAVVDPDLTENMPVKLAVSSALDAVAHAIESYWANGSNIISRALALGAVRTVMGHIDSLPGGEKNAHAYMAQGSVTAGMAFSSTKTTACHSISYPLTMKYGIPHGTAVSMLLAPVMEINSSSIADYNSLLDALGVNSAGELGSKIRNILTRAEIPCSLEAWGVKKDELPCLAALGITKGRADNNPVEFTEETILSVLEKIYNE